MYEREGVSERIPSLGIHLHLTFNVTDMAILQADLKAKGVTFVQESDVQPWGTSAIIQDSEGNHLILVEQPK